MYAKGTKAWAAALALTMALSPLAPITQAYAAAAIGGQDAAATEAPEEGATASDAPEGDGAEEQGEENPQKDITTPWMEIGDDEQPGNEQPGDEQPGDEQPGDEKPADQKPNGVQPVDHGRAFNVTKGLYYKGFVDAASAASDGDTIQMDSDEEIGHFCVIKKSITIDLNGHSLYNHSPYAGVGYASQSALSVQNGATVTITDSSESGAGTLRCQGYKASAIDIEPKGSVIIEGGSVIAEGDSSQGILHQGASLVINGGKVAGKKAAILRNNLSGACPVSVAINGGIVESSSKTVLGNLSSRVQADPVVVNGGSFSDDVANGNGFVLPEGQKLMRVTGEKYYTLREDVTDFSAMTCLTSMKLKDGIGVDITLQGYVAGSDIADYTAKWWLGDDEASASERALTAENLADPLTVSCRPMQLTDTIHVSVYCAGQDEPVATHELSAREYCMQIIQAHPDSEDARMCEALLRYGGASQRQFGYRTNDLADQDLQPLDESAATTDLEEYAAVVEGYTSLIDWASVTLSLEARTAINFSFEPVEGVRAADIPFMINDEALADGATISINEGRMTATRTTLEDDTVLITVTGIAPQDLGSAVELTIGEGNDCRIVRYSALSWAYAAQSEKDTAELGKALLAYGQAAHQ